MSLGVFCHQTRCSRTFWGGCGARRAAGQADLHPPSRCHHPPVPQTSPDGKCGLTGFYKPAGTPFFAQLGGFHTSPQGGEAAVAAGPAFGRSVGGGFCDSVESLSHQLLCGRVEFHPQNTYGETNWKLQRNMQNLHCASFQGTTRIPVKFINTVHMQSIELSK